MSEAATAAAGEPEGPPETPATPGRPGPPRKPRNSEVRSREHLLPDEVEKLANAAAKQGRHGHRDATMIRVAANHGLRVGELVGLKREQLDLDGATMHVRRSKRGRSSTHPIGGKELRDLRRLLKDAPPSTYVFVSELKAPLSPSAFTKILARAGAAAKLPIDVHPHMLRHACGYRLANKGVDTRAIQLYLGHRNIQHTTLYTELAADRFAGFADD